MTSLVIVESPAKCKKIEEYLGPGYKCIASFGHLRELNSLEHITDNYIPTYTIIDQPLKKKQVALLKKEIKTAKEVILATDDDREGESIAWHICDLFQLDVMKTKRIIFNEITKPALQYAIENPKTIDLNIVFSQQARQILDLLVGFKITPILWKLISKNKKDTLSAGRCQTPALKLIYDNYCDINAKHMLEKSYHTKGIFTNSNILFSLNKEFKNDIEIKNFLQESKSFNHMYTCSDPVQTFEQPPKPFTTSSLQQKVSNILHYSPKETMQICQILYEKGYITYMRTDSTKYSKEFIDTVKNYVKKNYNQDINALIIIKEGPHESIRCTDVFLSDLPDTINNTKERKLYKLIWEHTLESCMLPASYYSITANISAANNSHFSYNSEKINFPGWKIINEKHLKEDNNYQYLQTIQKNIILPYKKIISTENYKGLKQHYTEARLVQLLEEKGIGRPSTFSSLVEKIQERGYVTKKDIPGKEITCTDYELENNGNIVEINIQREFGTEHKKLVIEPLGIIVADFLYKYFNDLFIYDYTKQMEEQLDLIASGLKPINEICDNCNSLIIQLIKPFYLTQENEKGQPIKQKQIILGQHNGLNVYLKKGKFGLYIEWGENTKSLKQFGNRPLENIQFDEVKTFLCEDTSVVREINRDIYIKKGLKGEYIFYKTAKMKKPKFFDIKMFFSQTGEDYKLCNIDILKDWISNTYNI